MKYALVLTLGALLLPVGASAKSELDFRGRLMLDYTWFDGVHNDHRRGSEWAVRRARLGVTHRSRNDWRLKMEFNFDHDNDEVRLADGYAQYRGWDFARVTFGRKKEPFGLENSTSSLDISTMERSSVTDAFTNGRNFGVELSDSNDSRTFALGVFRNGQDDYGLDRYALTGRFTLSPVNTRTRLLHLGLSASIRDMTDATYRVNEPLELDPGNSVIESRRIQADRSDQIALEAAFMIRQFSIQGEWMQSTVREVSEVEPTNSVTFDGYYFLVSYFLTGESRRYDGSFDGVRPARASGAWELAGRYSLIDLVDQYRGTWAEAYTLSLNYYASEHFKFMLNLGWSDVRSSKPEQSGRGNTVGMRAQYSF